MRAPPIFALVQGGRVCVLGDQTSHAYPLSLLNPQLPRQKHNIWCRWRDELQDNVVTLTLQDDKAVDNLCANCALDPFLSCMDAQAF